MVKQLADDSRKDGGVVRFDAVIQDARPNHFHLIEAWRESPGYARRMPLADHTKAFRAQARTRALRRRGALRYDEVGL